MREPAFINGKYRSKVEPLDDRLEKEGSADGNASRIITQVEIEATMVKTSKTRMIR